ncbi:RNA-binding protein Raly-like isoform X2 [Macrobrachium rosenbergii]|uniref:RNA-binding protein Raly-like isoform X2 n=1 Tax=Macrobrachium nipponense TaxID=159736 RepID=UPI0030C8369D
MSKVGNQTNSQDPQAVNSRTFVGNLNTFQCTKTDVERMFQRYGRIAGISMHKGYAFVQFTNPFDARSACMGEDGRSVFGQILDVNLVAEPKPHQIGRKRPNVAKSGADCYNAGATLQGARLTPPLKRPRLVVPSLRQQPRAQSPKKVVTTPGLEDLKTYSSPDLLICGNCRELFSNLSDFIDHRRTYCKLRFTCKCSSHNGTAPHGSRSTSYGCSGSLFPNQRPLTIRPFHSPGMEESALLMCALCKENFASAWDLMVHAQAAHMVNIYQLASKDTDKDNGSCNAAGDNTAGSTEGSDVGMDSSADGGEASGDGADAPHNDDEPQPKQNGVGGLDDGEGGHGLSGAEEIEGNSTDIMNGASPPTLPTDVVVPSSLKTEAVVTQ